MEFALLMIITLEIKMNKLSIVVPIYKNEMNILPFYEDFIHNIKPHLEDYEIIMVHDASPDNSWTVMNQIASNDKKIKLIRLSRNFGSVAACFTGIQYSTGDCVTVKACDLQEPPELLLQMYDKWKNGAKSVIGVRESRNDPGASGLFSGIYYRLVRKMVSSDMPKGGFDTYLLDRKVADRIVAINDRNSPITLQILWMGFGPERVYYNRRKREVGKSSWTFSKKMKLFVDSFVGFSYIPIRIMSVVGLLFFLFSIIWAVYLVIAKLIGSIQVEGYTTIMVLILFSSGLIMFTLGLLGEYLWRTFDAARRRPISIVDEMVNFGNDDTESDLEKINEK